MSKENAQKFLDDVNGNAGLKKKLLDAASSAQAWVTEAATAGYQMTAEELRAAAEALIGKPVSADKLVGELRGLFEGQLGDDSLDAVTGGAGVAPIRQVNQPLQVQTVQARTVVAPGAAQAGDPHVREGGPVKVGFNPGGNQSTPGG